MSGFLALFHRSGRPVDPQLLQRLAERLTWRGPDGAGIWCDGPVGLVRTLFRTTAEREADPGPAGAEGVHITGDVRLDDRDLLIDRLHSAGHPVSVGTPDLVLVLHAYLHRGEDCLEMLAGDFSFVLWDSRQRRLFAARDQLGVNPLNYTEAGDVLAVSNSLHGLLAHPAVDDGIDQESIADYLAVGLRTRHQASFYRAIRRLGGGQCLSASKGAMQVRNYWTMPKADRRPVRRKPPDYAEEFSALFDMSLRDRLRGEQAAATHLSGGMDSSSIATSLARLIGHDATGGQLWSYTHEVDSFFPDDEGKLARSVARRAGVPLKIVSVERVLAGEEAVAPLIAPPEPCVPPFLSVRAPIERWAATKARILFTGYGGDPLFERGFDPGFAEHSLSTLWHLLGDAAYCLRKCPGMMRMWLSRFAARRRIRSRAITAERLLNADFAARYQVQQRRAEWSNRTMVPAIEAMAVEPLWTAMFAGADADVTGLPLKHRFPFFDLRVIRFVASLPKLPWRAMKTLLRVSMRDRLPPEVLYRRKTGVHDNVLQAFLRGHGPQPWMYDLIKVEALRDYVDRDAVIPMIDRAQELDLVTLRRLGFLWQVAYWLRDRPRSRV